MHQCALCCNDVMDQMRLTGPLHATKKLLDGGASLEAMLKKMKRVIEQAFFYQYSFVSSCGRALCVVK